MPAIVPVSSLRNAFSTLFAIGKNVLVTGLVFFSWGEVKLLLKDFKETSSKQLNQVDLTPRDDAENCKLDFHLKCLFGA